MAQQESDLSKALIRLEDTPVFTPNPDQQKVLFDFIRSKYLKTYRQLWTPDTVNLAGHTLLEDALPRGLAVEGKNIGNLTQEKSLFMTAIQRGIQMRDIIRGTAKEAFIFTDRFTRNAFSHYSGPYALSRQLLTDANQQTDGLYNKQLHFPLIRDIGRSNELAYLYNARRQLLAPLALVAVASLPKEIFPQAAFLDILRDRTEPQNETKFVDNMAKLVRNQILSICLGQQSPYVSITTLLGLTQETVEQTFTKDAFLSVQKHFAQIGITPNHLSYLQDLFVQTKEEIISAIQRRDDTSGDSVRAGGKNTALTDEQREERKRDLTHRYFSNALFINPAALEEKPMILRASEYRPDEYSLWTDGILIGDWIVPSVQRLLDAKRRAAAQPGMRMSTQQQVEKLYDKAIALWNTFNMQEAKETQDLSVTQANVQLISQKLRDFSATGVYASDRDREEAEFEARTHHYKGVVEPYEHARDALRRLRVLIETSDKAQLAAKRFQTMLNAAVFPPEAVIPFPDDMREILHDIDSQERTRSRGQARGRIKVAVGIIYDDFFTRIDMIVPWTEAREDDAVHLDMWQNLKKSDIEQRITLLKDTIVAEENKIRKNPNATVTFNPPLKAVSPLEYRYYATTRKPDEFARKRKTKQRLSDFDKKEEQVLHELTPVIQGQVRASEKTGEWIREFPSQLYVISLRKRLYALQSISHAREQIAQVKMPLSQIPLTVRFDEASAWVNRLLLPSVDSTLSDTLLDAEYPRMQKVSRVDYASPHLVNLRLDPILPDKTTLKSQLHTLQTILEAELEAALAKKTKREHWAKKSELEIVTHLLDALDSPLFPETAGVPNKQLWRQIGTRVRTIAALREVDMRQRMYTEAERLLRETQRSAYIALQERRLQNLHSEIDRLQKKPAQTEFLTELEKMQMLVRKPR